MTDHALSIDGLTKEYRVYSHPRKRLMEYLSLGLCRFHRPFQALNNVTLRVERGETLGIIGVNGSGKSTMLGLIAGVTRPSAGTISRNGRISSLLELGAGFHPEFSGRENVYLNGALLGFSRSEMNERMDAIEEFADIGDFIDRPVKQYSSGMYVRLAFSAAINVDPDILIVDEALSVGDMRFQLKCIDKMKSFRAKGVTILFVTHDLYTVRNFCKRVLWLENGEIRALGNVSEIADEYELNMRRGAFEKDAETNGTTYATEATIENVCVHSTDGEEREQFSVNESIAVTVRIDAKKDIENAVVGIALFDSLMRYVCGLNTKLDHRAIRLRKGRNDITLNYHEMPLNAGEYYVNAGVFESDAVTRYDHKAHAATFILHRDEYRYEGMVYLPHEWHAE